MPLLLNNGFGKSIILLIDILLKIRCHTFRFMDTSMGSKVILL